MDERDYVGLQGTIETLPANEVLRALCSHGSTGVLEIRGDAGRLSLSMLGGLLVAGDMERLFGSHKDSHKDGPKDRDELSLRLVDVLCSMLRIESGTYEFRDGAIERPGETRIELHDVLSRAIAVADALKALKCRVPSLDAIPMLIESEEDAPITLNRSMLRLVSHVDDNQSIAQIAGVIGLSAYEATIPIAELIALGILGSREPESRGAARLAPSENLDSRIAEATRDSVALAASLAEAHRSPYSDAAEQALADLAGGGESIEKSFESALNNDEPPVPQQMEHTISHAEVSEMGEVSGDREYGADDLSSDQQQTTITADRGALLRLFSGLRTDNG